MILFVIGYIILWFVFVPVIAYIANKGAESLDEIGKELNRKENKE